MLAHQLVVQRTQRPREIVLSHDRLVRHGHAVLPQLTQQNVQTFGGKPVEHEHRLLRRLRGVRALREACAAEREADRLRKVRRRYVSDARAHADQNGLHLLRTFSALRIVIQRGFTRFCHAIHLDFHRDGISVSLLAYSILLLYSFVKNA